jgi:hypothetical protein
LLRPHQLALVMPTNFDFLLVEVGYLVNYLVAHYQRLELLDDYLTRLMIAHYMGH